MWTRCRAGLASHPKTAGGSGTLRGDVPDRAERLPRRLGLASAIFVLVGSTIGSGIFRTPAVVAERAGTPAAFLGAWAAGGLVALAGALCLAELGAALPHTGGIYAYLRRIYGRRVAFAFGWAELVVLRPAAYGAIAVTTAEYGLRALGAADAPSGLGIPTSQWVAAGLLVAMGAVGRRGIHRAAAVQDVTTVIKIAALVILAAVAITAGGSGPTAPSPSSSPVAGVAGIGAAMAAVFWSYDGWSDVGFVGGEIRRPARNLPLAFLIGTAVVVGVYGLVNVGYLRVLSLDAVAHSPLVAADAAGAVFGAPAERWVAALVAVSTLGCLNGSLMTGPRVFYAMAADGLLPRALARVHPKHASPAAAIDLSVGLGALFVLARTFAQLADQFVLVIWPFYALCVVGVLRLRRCAPDLPRPYRVRAAPLWVLVFCAAAIAMVASYAVASPWTVAANAGLVAAAIPVYRWIQRRGRAA